VLAAGNGIVRAVEMDGELAGCIDFKRTDWAARTTETGYWAVPSFRGRGILTEATAALARWALTDVGLVRDRGNRSEPCRQLWATRVQPGTVEGSRSAGPT
jgi:hypothetical protein